MGNMERSWIVFLSVMLISDFVLSANVEKKAEKRVDEDSYISALQKNRAEDSLNPHGGYKDNSISSNPGYSYGPPVPTEYGPPASKYGPPATEYGPPASKYGPPATEYGPPASEYGPPATEYGPPISNELSSGYGSPPSSSYPPSSLYGPPSSSYPSSSYGPPSFPPSSVYGPPSSSSHPSFGGYPYGPRPINVYNYGPAPPKFPVVHSAPRDEHWLFDKFKFKLDLFTIGKILIKLIIFKKIIKFIALICLLLFLPRLQAKPLNLVDMLAGPDESEEETEAEGKRSFDYRQSRQKQINEVSRFAMTAIESFTDKHLSKCGNLSDIPCRFQSMVDVIDDKYPYERIIEIFMPVNQYNAFTPQKPNRRREKELKPKNVVISETNRYAENPSRQPSIGESSTQPTIAKTPQSHEFSTPSSLSSSSSSSSSYSTSSASSIESHFENSNSNRI